MSPTYVLEGKNLDEKNAFTQKLQKLVDFSLKILKQNRLRY